MLGLLYHIYWGTSGNSGLYLDEIYQVLYSAGIRQKAFVNYYYPFDYGEKIFFKRGDVSKGYYKGKVRKLFQLQEILFGFTKIIIASKHDRPSIINYSHVGQSYFFIIWFLRLIKRVSGAKLLITCHDVMPHSISRNEIDNRKTIFKLADYLLVHNHNSIKELTKIFNIDYNRVVQHPFPIMDLSKLIKEDTQIEKDTDFLFIGHLRKDKGIELLLDAWKDFYASNKRACLKVCGRKLCDSNFDENVFSNYNIDFNLHYITDEEYYRYIRRSRYVVLPYLQGTNSGIISTVLSLGAEVITSDIPMFQENPLVSKNNMFVSGNKSSLVSLLHMKWAQKELHPSSLVNDYRKTFKDSVVSLYTDLLAR